MDFGELIFKIGKGAKDGLTKIGLVKNGSNQEELCNTFASLDRVLEQKFTEDKKKGMGYNVVMLKHTLCKIKHLMKRGVFLELLQSEIN